MVICDHRVIYEKLIYNQVKLLLGDEIKVGCLIFGCQVNFRDEIKVGCLIFGTKLRSGDFYVNFKVTRQHESSR